MHPTVRRSTRTAHPLYMETTRGRHHECVLLHIVLSRGFHQSVTLYIVEKCSTNKKMRPSVLPEKTTFKTRYMKPLAFSSQRTKWSIVATSKNLHVGRRIIRRCFLRSPPTQIPRGGGLVDNRLYKKTPRARAERCCAQPHPAGTGVSAKHDPYLYGRSRASEPMIRRCGSCSLYGQVNTTSVCSGGNSSVLNY